MITEYLQCQSLGVGKITETKCLSSAVQSAEFSEAVCENSHHQKSENDERWFLKKENEEPMLK